MTRGRAAGAGERTGPGPARRPVPSSGRRRPASATPAATCACAGPSPATHVQRRPLLDELLHSLLRDGTARTALRLQPKRGQAGRPSRSCQPPTGACSTFAAVVANGTPSAAAASSQAEAGLEVFSFKPSAVTRGRSLDRACSPAKPGQGQAADQNAR